MAKKQAEIPPGWKNAEEIAVETDRSVSTIVDIAKDEGIPSTNFPGHRRRRFSPDAVKRIKAIVEERNRRQAPSGDVRDEGEQGPPVDE